MSLANIKRNTRCDHCGDELPRDPGLCPECSGDLCVACETDSGHGQCPAGSGEADDE